MAKEKDKKQEKEKKTSQLLWHTLMGLGRSALDAAEAKIETHLDALEDVADDVASLLFTMISSEQRDLLIRILPYLTPILGTHVAEAIRDRQLTISFKAIEKTLRDHLQSGADIRIDALEMIDGALRLSARFRRMNITYRFKADLALRQWHLDHEESYLIFALVAPIEQDAMNDWEQTILHFARRFFHETFSDYGLLAMIGESLKGVRYTHGELRVDLFDIPEVSRRLQRKVGRFGFFDLIEIQDIQFGNNKVQVKIAFKDEIRRHTRRKLKEADISKHPSLGRHS